MKILNLKFSLLSLVVLFCSCVALHAQQTAGYIPEFTNNQIILQNSPCDDAITNPPGLTCTDIGGFIFKDPNFGMLDYSTFNTQTTYVYFETYDGGFTYQDLNSDTSDYSFFNVIVQYGGVNFTEAGGGFNLKGGPLNLPPFAFAALGTITAVQDGSTIYCTDCKGPQDDATWGSVAVDSGTGSLLVYESHTPGWRVH